MLEEWDVHISLIFPHIHVLIQKLFLEFLLKVEERCFGEGNMENLMWKDC